MKLGIHTLWLGSDPGFSSYYVFLLENLAKIDSRNFYTVYLPHEDARRKIPNLPARFQIRPLWPASSWIQIPVSLPLELIWRPVDVLHVNVVAPPFCPVPYIQTLNDMDYALNPGFYPKPIRVRLARLVPPSTRRATKIITASHFSKKCIMDLLGVPSEKIAVVYQGINPVYRRVEDPQVIQQVRTKYGLAEPFILFVGKLQTRKNIIRLLKAFHILKKEKGVRHKLVLVGGKSFAFSEIEKTLDELNLRNDVALLGEVPLGDLVLLYNAADLFVFPSLSEGFGVPPLEAMACGTPVVASNATSIPEVVGDAGLKVDPYKVDEITQAMHAVITSNQLRNDLITRGLKRVTLFSNLTFAETTLEVFHEVYRMHSRPAREHSSKQAREERDRAINR